MRSITSILNTKGLSSLNDCAKVKLLLYGDDSLSRDENSIILRGSYPIATGKIAQKLFFSDMDHIISFLCRI